MVKQYPKRNQGLLCKYYQGQKNFKSVYQLNNSMPQMENWSLFEKTYRFDYL